ncbi:MAG: hypothetical protein KDD44_04340 [Bdellovibrionales bacterium]|nr:hypothetical protein [Bdellovibrionales bacterium]
MSNFQHALRALAFVVFSLAACVPSVGAVEAEEGMVSCLPPDGGTATDASSGGDHVENLGDTCVIDSDINGKVDGDFTLRASYPVFAKFDLLECLEKKGVYRFGRGTKVTLAGRKALCECQREMVRERIDCNYDWGSPITQDECEKIKKILEKGGMATMSLFKGPGLGHDIQIVDLKCNFNGFVGVIYRDPNSPDRTRTGIVDPNDGSFTTGDNLNKSKNLGHYAVQPY